MKVIEGRSDGEMFSNMSVPRTENDGGVMNTMTFKEHIDMYCDFFFKKGEKKPLTALPQDRVDVNLLLNNEHKGILSAWLGHSSLLINIDGSIVLTDPVFERKVSPVGPIRFHRQLPLKVEELPFVDVVIISHDHYDHLNKYSVRQLEKKTALFVVPLGVGQRLEKWGIKRSKIVELNWWDSYRVKNDLAITATPAQHFSGRGLFDKNRTLWASWAISTDHHRVFFSGDSGYFPGFKEIGEKYGPFDVAFMECGAYNQHWSNIHMFPEQTVQAFQDIKGKVLHPIHWATFNLALHAWYEPIERVTAAATRHNITIATPVIGQVVDYNQPISSKSWWLPAMKASKGDMAPQPDFAGSLR